jgi:DNA-binding CsgD family transcriptional regulator
MLVPPSPTEQNVLNLVMQGLANKEICRKLDLAEGTVKVHVKSLLRKFDAKNRTQLALLAMRRAEVGGVVPARVQDDDTYLHSPNVGWTCFHCGDTFLTPHSAKMHFGFDPTCEPACRIKLGAEMSLLRHLRELEAENSRLMSQIAEEGTEAAKSHYYQMTRHSAQLQAAEELGYSRGIADARKEMAS